MAPSMALEMSAGGPRGPPPPPRPPPPSGAAAWCVVERRRRGPRQGWSTGNKARATGQLGGPASRGL
eukprot:7817256-Pyramimonas_sp.AAC.1